MKETENKSCCQITEKIKIELAQHSAKWTSEISSLSDTTFGICLYLSQLLRQIPNTTTAVSSEPIAQFWIIRDDAYVDSSPLKNVLTLKRVASEEKSLFMKVLN